MVVVQVKTYKKKGEKMQIKMIAEEVKITMGQTAIAHIKITLDRAELPEKYKYETTWRVQCTGFGIVVKGDHNMGALRWFLNVAHEEGIDTYIREFAAEVITAHEVLTKEQVKGKVARMAPAKKIPRRKAPAKQRVLA
tara:strand:+ start:2012 stop:2425 length:414 start_codon:yes stop_codon:yes gene_type:complete